MNKNYKNMEKRIINEYEQGNYTIALQEVNNLIKTNNKASMAYNLRGVIYGALNNFDSAINDFSKSISIDGNNYKSFYNRGILTGKKDKAKSVADLNICREIIHKQLQKEESNTKLRLALSETLYLLEEKDKSEIEYQKVIESDKLFCNNIEKRLLSIYKLKY